MTLHRTLSAGELCVNSCRLLPSPSQWNQQPALLVLSRRAPPARGMGSSGHRRSERFREGEIAMRPQVFALLATGILISSALLPGVGAGARAFQLAQADPGGRIGPTPSPRVLIEEPRPPRAAIETEGRGERRNCRPLSTTVTEGH